MERSAGRAAPRGQGRSFEPTGVCAARRGAAPAPGLRTRGARPATRADPRSDEPADPVDAEAGAYRAAARSAAADPAAGAAARRDQLRHHDRAAGTTDGARATAEADVVAHAGARGADDGAVTERSGIRAVGTRSGAGRRAATTRSQANR